MRKDDADECKKRGIISVEPLLSQLFFSANLTLVGWDEQLKVNS